MGPFWGAVAATSVLSIIEVSTVGAACEAAMGRLTGIRESLLRVGSERWGSDVSLRDPLLGSGASSQDVGLDIEKGIDDGEEEVRKSEVPESDIKADATEYSAGWSDLFRICLPDLHLIIFAFVMLTLAAVAQVYIPRFTGNILDALGADGGDGKTFEGDVWDVPGFSEVGD